MIAAFAGVACLLLALPPASAGQEDGRGQADAEPAVTLGAIKFRDELISAQEALLNGYRCRFGVDAEQVEGGCEDGLPKQALPAPGPFEGSPSQGALNRRDRLIAAQAQMLNAFRCRYDYHTSSSAVPRGCSVGTPSLSLDFRPEPASLPNSGGLPRMLVTSLGVSVAVLAETVNGYVVLTPCGNFAEVSAGTPIHRPRVVIDPGHGGRYDIGARGPNGLAEKDLNLNLAHALFEELARREIPAAFTRTGDYDIPLSVRATFADLSGAEALVSLHHNAPTSRIGGGEPGTEVYIQSESRDRPRADSSRLGGLLYEESVAALSGFDGVEWASRYDAGVMRVLSSERSDAYGMIRRPKLPTALMEYGYLSNPTEADLFATGEYLREAARATANAIEAFLNTDRPGAKPNTTPRIFDPSRAPTRCDEPALE
ncbi:N-acetylmuramoyl-L-alanine amidase family protein [Candidatus Poriferisocius sp.]|uniref:N-acetylmuramoyl-L-alanine amidase family protein n=1 Tax=Candidatus Poriferisocius sp. TaxID=3101276 RepID=UPI003B015664